MSIYLKPIKSEDVCKFFLAQNIEGEYEIARRKDIAFIVDRYYLLDDTSRHDRIILSSLGIGGGYSLPQNFENEWFKFVYSKQKTNEDKQAYREELRNKIETQILD